MNFVVHNLMDCIFKLCCCGTEMFTEYSKENQTTQRQCIETVEETAKKNFSVTMMELKYNASKGEVQELRRRVLYTESMNKCLEEKIEFYRNHCTEMSRTC